MRSAGTGEKGFPESSGAGYAVNVPLAWLTTEIALYGLIFSVGLAVRLAALGRWPLLDTELSTALAAWRTLQGSTWRPDVYSPLLYTAQWLLFGLTRATDATARLLPALVGAALVWLPYGARGMLGRKGAVLAALLFALAPTWVFFSRTADGAILATSAWAVLLLAFYRYVQGRRSQDLRMAAVALGLGVTTGPGWYTPLVAAIGFGAILWWRWRGDVRLRQIRTALGGMVVPEAWALSLGVALLAASSFLVNPGGIGTSVDLVGQWAAALLPGRSDLPWTAFTVRLLTYEALTMVLALVGGIWGLWRRDLVDGYLIFWAVLAWLFGTVLGHREPIWMLSTLLPLVILAARGFERGWNALTTDISLLDGLVVALALPVAALSFLGLASFAHTGQDRFLFLARLGLGLLLLAWALYWIWGQRASAWRVGSVLLGLALLVTMARSTTALAYQTARDPRERMVYRPVSVQLRDLEDLVTRLSFLQAGDPHAINIQYERSLDPWLAWALRDFPGAQSVPAIDNATQAAVFISSLRARDAWPAGYVGQRFRLAEDFPLQDLSSRERLRWLLYRDPVGYVGGNEVQVWVRAPMILGDEGR